MSRVGFQKAKVRKRRRSESEPLSADEIVALEPEILRTAVISEMCVRSFRDFVAFAWPELHGGRPMVDAWHLGVIADHLQAVADGRIQRLGINVPPGFGKSVLVSVLFPAWLWLRDPALRILAVSGIEEVLLRDSMRLHYLVYGEWYQHTFFPRWKQHPASNSKKSWMNSAGGHHVVRTTKQRITGVRSDIILIDDPSDATEGYADKASLDETNEWYDGALSTRGDKGSKWILIQQRLAENDLTGHIMDQDPAEWEWVILPNEWDGEIRSTCLGEYDPRRTKWDLLFPWLVDAKKTKEIRERMGTDRYYAQYQQQPSPPGGSVFHEETFRYWSPRTLPEQWDRVLISADLAGYKKKAKTRMSDPAVIQLWGQAGRGYYLLEQYRAKDLGIQKAVEVVLSLVEKVPEHVDEVVIENKAVGPEVQEIIGQKLAGSGIRIVGYDPTGTSKHERAIAVQPLFETGRVFLPHPRYAMWVKRILMPELMRFPRVQHDDQVDTMTQALLYMERQGSGLQVFSLSKKGKK